MQFEVYAKGLATLSVDCIVLGVFEDGELSEEAGAIDSASGGLLKKLLGARRLLRPQRRDTAAHRRARNRSLARAADRPGHTEELRSQERGDAPSALPSRRCCAPALRALRSRSSGPPGKELDDYYFGRAVAEIVGNSLYRVNDLKTAKKPKAPALQKVLAGPVKKVGHRGRRARPRARRGDCRRRRLAARSGQPAGERLHADLPGRAGQGAGQAAHLTACAGAR